MFCCTLLYVHFSIAIILRGKRELIALLNLSSWCLVMVERLFLTVPRGCLQFVIVVFPDHTHLLFLMVLLTFLPVLGLSVRLSTPSRNFFVHLTTVLYDIAWSPYKCVLKRVSFGSKDCTKELKLECAYFLGHTS